MVVKAIIDGHVVPFLGAGANLCGRPRDLAWSCRQGDYLPSGGELAEHLADEYYYPQDDKSDLLRVSQYVALVQGSGPLYLTLHNLFDSDYPPTSLHRFLATLPAALRQKGYPPRYLLIVTTNYDDVTERAFQAVGEPFDVVSYVAEGDHRGKFLHWPPEGEPILIQIPNEYTGLPLEVRGPRVIVNRTVILKIHGAVDRANMERDSFVITEDHYIDYLTRTDISNLMPVKLAAKLRRSHFLFLGYGLRDWNLRVILHRIWGTQVLTYKSWAIRRSPDPIDEQFWNRRDVDILNVRLEQYVAALSERIQALPAAGGAP
jgi:hypothetical protein